MRALLLLVLLGAGLSGARAQGAPTRLWRPDERVLLTDLTRVTALGATRAVLYAATPEALVVYDRAFGSWRETLGVIDGFPGGPVTAMVADPGDDTAWLGAPGRWILYEPLGRRWATGPLPGTVDAVVLDGEGPARGAYFHTAGGWYFVPRGGVAAEPARDLPPPGRRIGSLTMSQLLARAPALDVVRFRIERDEFLRAYTMTAAATVPVTNEVFIATSGNGVFRVDLRTYSTERLPAGLLGAGAAAVAVSGDRVCAGSDGRGPAARRGITCFRDDLSSFTYFEGYGAAGVPGTVVRRLLAADRGLWAATDQGLVRVDPRSRRVRQLLVRDGLPSDDVRALAIAPDGVWAGTSRGVAVAVEAGGEPAAQTVALTGTVVSTLAAREDTLWIGSAMGLFVLPPGADAPAPVGGSMVVRQPIVALALKADTLLVATESRLAWRAGAEWHVVDPPGPPIGRLTALAVDHDGFWVAGTGGVALYRPATGFWSALTSPGDVPLPVWDVAASRDYLWVATPAGVVRYARRVLVP